MKSRTFDCKGLQHILVFKWGILYLYDRCHLGGISLFYLQHKDHETEEEWDQIKHQRDAIDTLYRNSWAYHLTSLDIMRSIASLRDSIDRYQNAIQDKLRMIPHLERFGIMVRPELPTSKDKEMKILL